MNQLWALWSDAPAATKAAASLAIVVALVALGPAAWASLRWRWLRRACDRATQVLEERWRQLSGGPAFERDGLERHRLFYERGDEMLDEVLEALRERERAWAPFRRLLDDVHGVHRMRRVGGDGGWADLVAGFLDRQRAAIDRLRQMAGITVLAGLAGTVLGFVDAVPRLREAFRGPEQAVSELGYSPHVVEVLSGLGGVFLATLVGVGLAAVLYLVAAVLEIPFGGLAERVDRLGHRWLANWMQAPGSPLEEVFRNEVDRKFERLGDRLVEILSPVVRDLRTALETMPPLVARFTHELNKGQEMMTRYQSGAQKLASSADAAVRGFQEIVAVSTKFAADVPRLQEETGAKIEEAVERLVVPIASFSTAVEELRGKVGEVERHSQRIARSGTELAAREDSIQGALERQAAALREAIGTAGEQRRAVETAVGELVRRQEGALAGISDEIGRAGERQAQELGRTVSETIQGLAGRHEAVFERFENNQQAALASISDHLTTAARSAVGTELGRVVTGIEQLDRRMADDLTRQSESLEHLRDSVSALSKAPSSPVRPPTKPTREAADPILLEIREQGSRLARIEQELRRPRSNPLPSTDPAESVTTIDPPEAARDADDQPQDATSPTSEPEPRKGTWAWARRFFVGQWGLARW